MASGIITGTTSNNYIVCRVVWSSEADTSSNASYVTAELQYRRTNEGYVTYGTGTFSITIDGRIHRETHTIEISEGWIPVMSFRYKVAHNEDGTKSFSITATGAIPGTTLESTNCSGTATLDTIPRASTIISARNLNLGAKCEVKWQSRSTAFRFKIKFVVGGWSYTTEAIHPNQTSAYTYTGYTIPLEVAEQFTNTNIYTGATITLYTYSDANATTQVGTASTKTVWAQVPINSSTQPTVSMTLSPVSDLPSIFSGLYIRGKSKVQATFSGEGKYGASIKAYSMEVSGLGSYDSPYQSGLLPNAGTVSVSGKSKDSRGIWSNATTKDITVIPYSAPKVVPAKGEKLVICERCDENGQLSDSGTYLKIKAGVSYSKVVNGEGEQKNFCDLRYRYRTESATSFSPWYTIPWRNPKNLIPYPYSFSSKTTGGITYSTDEKGVITINGTSTGSPSYIEVAKFTVPEGIYAIGGINGGSSSTYRLRILTNDSTSKTEDLYDGFKTVTVSGGDCTFSVLITVTNGATVDNVKIKPMFNKGSVLEPYSFDGDNMDITLGNIVSDIKTSYLVQIGAIDSIGEDSEELQFVIPTDHITMHFRHGGKGVAIGKYSELENAFEIADDWDVIGRVYGLGKGKANIPSGADLNTYKDFGVFGVVSNDIAKSLINCPTTTAGTLIVSSATSSGENDGIYVYILQRYITFDGKYEYYRLMHTGGTGSVWSYNAWNARSDSFWKSLGLSTNVTKSDLDYGRYVNGDCSYRVINENHVYVAFNCSFTYSGNQIVVNKVTIPEEYRPPRNVYAMCAVGGRVIARVFVMPSGNVGIDWVQDLSTTGATTSSTVYWIDGYIDYWV